MISTGHIDADILVFRSAFACEKAQYKLTYVLPDAVAAVAYFDTAKDCDAFMQREGITEYEREKSREPEPFEHVVHNMKLVLESIAAKAPCDQYVLYLTGSNNFRRQITPEYKANRAQTMRPYHFQAAREWLIQQAGAVVTDGYEADDAIGMAYRRLGNDVVISLDKDLRAIPGRHYNWVKDVTEIITEQEAAANFFRQFLIGDTADNIQGIKGIGPKKAAQLLPVGMSPDKMRGVVQRLYKKHKLDYEMNYRLLRILRSQDEYEETKRWLKARQVPKA